MPASARASERCKLPSEQLGRPTITRDEASDIIEALARVHAEQPSCVQCGQLIHGRNVAVQDLTSHVLFKINDPDSRVRRP